MTNPSNALSHWPPAAPHFSPPNSFFPQVQHFSIWRVVLQLSELEPLTSAASLCKMSTPVKEIRDAL